MPSSSLGQISLPEGTFEHDTEISKKYQDFSAELIRLALLGIGGISFLVSNIFLNKSKEIEESVADVNSLKNYLTTSLIFLGISLAAALIHRYIGSDALAYHLRTMRLELRGDEDEATMIKSKRGRDHRFLTSKWLLIISAASLWVGAISLAIAFIKGFL